MHTTRKGFTLIELMIALVLLVIVGGGMFKLLTSQQRATRQQAAQSMLQANIRTGTLLVPSELREINVTAAGSDIVAMGPDSITYRAMRATSVVCAITTTEVRLRNEYTFGYRAPVPGRDKLLIFVENDAASSLDDGWTTKEISAATGSTCPDGGNAVAYTVAVTADTVAMVRLDAVARTFEVMQLKLYQSGGRNWLGARSVSGGEVAVQPVLGPLTAAGLRLTYLNAAGGVTTDSTQVRTIDIMVQGETDNAVSNGSSTQAIKMDSLTARIRLRNAPRL
jgi:prepilin-type N-terminal cleavage/methylation domain-containing protein